jgi:hypothetical protein
MRPLLLLIIAGLLSGCGQKTVKPVSYHEQIQPILNSKCVNCHGVDVTRGKIALTSYASVMKSRTFPGKKPLVVALEPAKSWLYIVCATNQPHYRMPPDTSTIVALPKEQLQLLAKWIEEGAQEN